MKKQMGITWDVLIYHDTKSITPKEMDDFVDEVIELAEKRKWAVGGGFNLIDVTN